MTISRYWTAEDILNAALVETGLSAVTDPITDSDRAVTQMRYLLATAGLELLNAYDWPLLTEEALITVNHGDTGLCDLPNDFERMLNQTGWNRTSTTPLGGPLSPQEWQYFKGTSVSLGVLNVTFRYNKDQIKILPVPPASGTDPYASIYYEYISRGWVEDGTTPGLYKDSVDAKNDIIRYDPLVVVKFLKLRFLGAKGFDTTDAGAQFEVAFNSATGKDTPAPVMSIARHRTGFRYIDQPITQDIGS